MTELGNSGTDAAVFASRIQCPNECGAWTDLSPDAQLMECSGCKVRATFAACDECTFTFSVIGSNSNGWGCPLCSATNKRGHASTAGRRVLDLSEWLQFLATDPHGKILTRSTVIGGHGHALAGSTECIVLLAKGRLVVRPKFAPQEYVVVPWDQITSVEFGGDGEIQRGGGFMGGGFGIVGFAVGVAAATALNAATSRTSMDSQMYVRWDAGELILHSGQYTPEALRVITSQLISHVEHGARARQVESATAVVASPADELAKIKALFDDGVLTVEEYESARVRLVRLLTGAAEAA